MKEITVTCDKCKKVLHDFGQVHVVITNDHRDIPLHEFDFCGECYGNFIRTVGSFIKGEE